MPIALGALQDALELLDKGLPPLRVGPAEQLLGLLPRQLAAVQDRADRLATAPQPKALADPMDEAAQGPARGWISPFEGGGGRRALGGADHLAEFGFAARAKKATPAKLAGMSAAPVRPNRRPGHGGSGCAGSGRGACGRGGGATPSRRPG